MVSIDSIGNSKRTRSSRRGGNEIRWTRPQCVIVDIFIIHQCGPALVLYVILAGTLDRNLQSKLSSSMVTSNHGDHRLHVRKIPWREWEHPTRESTDLASMIGRTRGSLPYHAPFSVEGGATRWEDTMEKNTIDCRLQSSVLTSITSSAIAGPTRWMMTMTSMIHGGQWHGM